jgi:putative membrane protein
MKNQAQAQRAELDKLQGAVFEAAYVDAMVKGHSDVLIKLDAKFLPAARNAVVANHLRDTRGRVVNHLTQAQRLDGNPQASL